MKFLCVDCDERMEFADRQVPGDGTLAAVFECPSCGRATGLLTNPMETQLVSSMGVKIGGREVPDQPMESTRTQLREGRDEAFDDTRVPPADGAPGAEPPGEGGGAGPEAAASEAGGPEGASSEPAGAQEAAREDEPGAGKVQWSPAAVERLQRVPSFVRGMVRRIYTEWAEERDIAEITPDVMDRARSDLGLEGM